MEKKKFGINDAIEELWKSRFFTKHCDAKMVTDALWKKFELTSSNVAVHLNSKRCKKILRKNKQGWIQKYGSQTKKPGEQVAMNTNTDLFDFLNLHPAIRKSSRKKFIDGHFDDSIFAAFKKVNNTVKKVSEKSIDGKSLMLNVFSPKNPVIELANLSTETGRNIQEGFMHLYAGGIQGIRNPRGHEDEDNDEVLEAITDPKEAIKYLAFASILVSFLDDVK